MTRHAQQLSNTLEAHLRVGRGANFSFRRLVVFAPRGCTEKHSGRTRAVVRPLCGSCPRWAESERSITHSCRVGRIGRDRLEERVGSAVRFCLMASYAGPERGVETAVRARIPFRPVELRPGRAQPLELALPDRCQADDASPDSGPAAETSIRVRNWRRVSCVH